MPLLALEKVEVHYGGIRAVKGIDLVVPDPDREPSAALRHRRQARRAARRAQVEPLALDRRLEEGETRLLPLRHERPVGPDHHEAAIVPQAARVDLPAPRGEAGRH